MLEDRTATASIGGPFRIFSKDGADLTPKSALRQAILAVLVTSPGQIRARSSIQEMFWNGVDPNRAAGRLKTALSALRNDLDELGRDTLRSDRTIVSLAPNRISLSTIGSGALEIFEGMDLKLESADFFERWLQDARTNGLLGTEYASTPIMEYTERPQSQVSLGLLTPQHVDASNTQISIVGKFINDIVAALSQLSQITIQDLRSDTIERRALPTANSAKISVFLSTIFRGSAGRSELAFQLVEATTKEILWTSKALDLNLEDATLAANFIAEQILDRISNLSTGQNTVNLLPWTTLSGLFSLDPDTIIGTEEQLSLISPDDEDGIVRPLQVFAQIFRENEGLAQKQEIDPEWLIEALNSVGHSARLRALSESLLGYSAHMLSNDQKLGSLLVEQSYLRAPQLALNLDHLAVVRLSQGDINGANEVFHACLKTTQLSPWRYSFEVTGAMIALAKGDIKSSLAYANSALMRKPKFLGALRYAMVGCALSGEARDAHRMKLRIQQLRPGYDFSTWLESVMRRSAPKIGKNIVDSFERNNLI